MINIATLAPILAPTDVSPAPPGGGGTFAPVLADLLGSAAVPKLAVPGIALPPSGSTRPNAGEALPLAIGGRVPGPPAPEAGARDGASKALPMADAAAAAANLLSQTALPVQPVAAAAPAALATPSAEPMAPPAVPMPQAASPVATRVGIPTPASAPLAEPVDFGETLPAATADEPRPAGVAPSRRATPRPDPAIPLATGLAEFFAQPQAAPAPTEPQPLPAAAAATRSTPAAPALRRPPEPARPGRFQARDSEQAQQAGDASGAELRADAVVGVPTVPALPNADPVAGPAAPGAPGSPPMMADAAAPEPATGTGLSAPTLEAAQPTVAVSPSAPTIVGSHDIVPASAAPRERPVDVQATRPTSTDDRRVVPARPAAAVAPPVAVQASPMVVPASPIAMHTQVGVDTVLHSETTLATPGASGPIELGKTPRPDASVQPIPPASRPDSVPVDVRPSASTEPRAAGAGGALAPAPGAAPTITVAALRETIAPAVARELPAGSVGVWPAPSARAAVSVSPALTTAPVAREPLLPPPPAAAARPALQAFGAALHRAVVAERRPAGILVDPSAATVPVTAPTQLPPATVATPLDMTQPRWPDAMMARIEQVREAQTAPGTPADTRVRLHPDALGAIDVAIRSEGDAVTVHFAAAEPATQRLLADAQPRLQELADARGLKLGQAGVDSGAGQGGERRAPTPQPATPSRPAQVRADTQTQIDTRLA